MWGSDSWIGEKRDRRHRETPHQHHDPFDDYHRSHGDVRSMRNVAETVILDGDNPPARRSPLWNGD
jgi:hypothetical protein